METRTALAYAILAILLAALLLFARKILEKRRENRRIMRGHRPYSQRRSRR